MKGFLCNLHSVSQIYRITFLELPLTHHSPLLLFYTPRKHQKTFRFPDVFRGYGKATPGCNRLTTNILKTPEKLLEKRSCSFLVLKGCTFQIKSTNNTKGGRSTQLLVIDHFGINAPSYMFDRALTICFITGTLVFSWQFCNVFSYFLLCYASTESFQKQPFKDVFQNRCS